MKPNLRKTILLIFLNISYLTAHTQEKANASAVNSNERTLPPNQKDIQQQFINSDIDNFWVAYDKIKSTKDTVLQYNYIKEFYLDKGTEGLNSLIKVRRYTPKDFIDAINNYPQFWQSLRENSLNTKAIFPEIETDIKKLRTIYPTLKSSTIYFLIGAFRTNGTILEDRVLIGSEYALGDETTKIDEFPTFRQNFYKDNKPKQNIALLCTHEYIHTQQNEPLDNLLSYCIYEGVAEYISCLATGKKSNTPSIDFGKKNQKKVVNKFLEDLYFGNLYNWLWGENQNELKVRDLGYYIGYEICERYYNLATNKTQAIKELIELDYTNEKELARIVDMTKLFPKPLAEMWNDYERLRPTVIDIKPISNDKQKISSGNVQFSITFSEEMDTTARGFDVGPLGADFVCKVSKIVGWRNQNKTFTFETQLYSNRKYQTAITSNFSNKKGIRLKPFLLEFETE